MAKVLLFEFWVKPSGFLASKRYARVYVDDTSGVITRENVPGKEAINLPSIDDYKSTNYPYSEGSEITSFCNFTTFTKYHILASRVTPFATTTADFNEPACGYLTPLPEPAVPFNPFGTANYDLYAFYEYCDIDKVPFTVNIYRRNNTGVPLVPFQIEEADSDVVIETYDCGDDKFTPIRAKTFEFTFMAQENFYLKDLYSFDEREFKLEHVNDVTGIIDFKGFIIPDNAQEPFIAPPYPVKVRATDGLGALKELTYPMPLRTGTGAKQQFTHILAYALSLTNLNLNIRTVCNLYAAGMPNGLDNDPLDLSKVSPLRMVDTSGNVYSAYQALEAVCLQFGASIAQVNGEWVFYRATEFALGTPRYRLYDYKALFLRSGTMATSRNAGYNLGVELINRDHVVTIGNAYKSVKVIQEFGRAPDIIFNGDFEIWNGSNFDYWTRYGAISITRVQKSVIGGAGTSYLIDDYACRFLQKADVVKWLEATPTWINKGQTTKISMNIGKTDGVHDLRVLFKVDQFYLTNANGTFEWVTSTSTCSIRVDNSIGDIFSFAINIELPSAPISGDLTIQLYGFIKLVAVNSGSTPPSGARPSRGTENGVGGNDVVTYYEVDDYTPIDIDNVAISATVDQDKIIKGLINVSAQHGLYTQKPKDISIIWGEFRQGSLNPMAVTGSYVPARPPRPGQDNPQKQLQTIYLLNDDAATGWYEFGGSSNPVPIGLCLAKSILRNYQQPFIFFSGSFRGDDLSYLDTFNIIVDGQPEFSAKTFVWQQAEFNRRKKTVNGTLVETFSKKLLSNDYTTPQLPGSSSILDPPIVQNPNPLPILNGIFVEQFTPEYV